MAPCLLVTKSSPPLEGGLGKSCEQREYHGRTKKLDYELHGTQQDQKSPIESQLIECGHNGRLLTPVIILDLVARELAREHTAFYDLGFSEAKAMSKQKLA